MKNTHGGMLLLVKLKPATLLKVTLLRGCFYVFLNCTNGTKSCNVSHMVLTMNISVAYTVDQILKVSCLQRCPCTDTSSMCQYLSSRYLSD